MSAKPLPLLLFTLVALRAESLPVKPESVGLSEQRLTRIHETMERHIQAKNISGAVTLVARKGRIAHLQAHGSMDLESKRAMTKDAIFRIYSMSKPVAGVAILMLVEQGKVRLNDPVSRFIPEMAKLGVTMSEGRREGRTEARRSGALPASREVTIQDLLTHVSGLGSGPLGSAEAMKLFPGLSGSTLAATIPKYAAIPLDFQPGSRWSYSGLAGFDVLGRVVEVVSGSTFDQFLKESLFGPLGMKTTGFHPGDEHWSRVVTAYHRGDGALQKTKSPNGLQSKTYFSGAGGLVSTAEDYAQFGMMLAGGGQLNGKRLLSPKTVEWMASAFVPDTVPGRQAGQAFGLSVRV